MKKLSGLVCILLASVSLYADAPKGAYVGLGLGSSVFDDGGYSKDVNNYLVRSGYSARVNENYDSSGYMLYGGYQFNKVVAVEASYIKYGKYSLDSTNGNSMILNPTSIAITANLGYNIGEKAEFRPFGIIGLASVKFDETGEVKAYETNSITAIRVGVGFEYAPASLYGIALRLAYESDTYSVKFDETSSDLEDTYAQAIGMLYISVQYKF